MISGFKLNSAKRAQARNELLMAAMCRDVPNDLVILMAAYEALSGLVGQKFQTEHLSRKNTQTSRSKNHHEGLQSAHSRFTIKLRQYRKPFYTEDIQFTFYISSSFMSN
jgi:hypothetical protein